MNEIGHNVGKMSAADRERSIKALRALRASAEKHQGAYHDHQRECVACGRETDWLPSSEDTRSKMKVVLHCHAGYTLAMTAAGFDMLYRTSKANLATFGVHE